MNILHINIGRPPFYNGGSILACEDLMKAQCNAGHTVSFLYPGHSSLIPHSRISKHTSKDAVNLFEIINPLPVPLLSGISNPSLFLGDTDPKIYTEFFDQHKIDIIHIHSLMGLHPACIYSAKKAGIKMIFTTHDYYPMCPRCTLIDVNGDLCESHDYFKCTKCNENAGLPVVWEIFNRSRSYRYLKHLSFFKALRKIGRSFLKSKQKPRNKISIDLNSHHELTKISSSFKDFISQQDQMIQMMDVIHCNSEISKDEYLSSFPDIKVELIPIARFIPSPRDVSRPSLNNEFRIGYVGGNVIQKGIELLYTAFESLPQTDMRWKLILWGDDYSSHLNSNKQIIQMGRYNKSELEKVYSSMDVLIVPSIWLETFGLVVQEALTYGIPVLCSNHVGAKVLLKDFKFNMVFPIKNPKILSERIIALSDPIVYASVLSDLRRLISSDQFDLYYRKMDKLYQSLLNGSSK